MNDKVNDAQKVGLAIVAVIAVIAVIVALCSGCQENQKLTLWGLTAHDADVNVRVGIDANEMEVYFAVKELTDHIEWKPDAVGVGFLFHPTQMLSITDTPAYLDLSALWAGLTARPYAGIEADVPLHGDQRELRFNFPVGVTLAADGNRSLCFVTEYMTGDGVITEDDDYALYIGARYKFK